MAQRLEEEGHLHVLVLQAASPARVHRLGIRPRLTPGEHPGEPVAQPRTQIEFANQRLAASGETLDAMRTLSFLTLGLLIEIADELFDRRTELAPLMMHCDLL